MTEHLQTFSLIKPLDHASEVQVTMMLTESCKLRGLHHRYVQMCRTNRLGVLWCAWLKRGERRKVVRIFNEMKEARSHAALCPLL